MRKANKRPLDSRAFDAIQAARRLTPAEFINQARVESPPKDWVTSDAISAASGLAESTVAKHIRSLRQLGKVEERKFTIRAGKRVMPVTHYRLSEDAAAVYFPNGLPE